MMRAGLNKAFLESISLYGANYSELSDDAKQKLGSLVNNTLTLSKLFEKTIED